MSEWLLRCTLVIRVVGGLGSLIIDCTEALQRTWRRCPSLLVANAVSPEIDIVERASGMERSCLFTSGAEDAQRGG
jgi:hypothetical protein